MQSKSIKKSIVKISDCFWSVYAYNIINKTEKDVINLRETRILEFKEMITNTFLKTVSAFSNYASGTIFFGVIMVELLKVYQM